VRVPQAAAAAIALLAAGLAAAPASPATASGATPANVLSGIAGYVASGTGPYSSVSTSWTQTTVACLSNADDVATWVGLDGFASSTIEQIGVDTSCASGAPVTEGWYELYPAAPIYLSPTSYPVSPGDSVSASVSASGTTMQLTLADHTHGWTYTKKVANSVAHSSAEIVVEGATGKYPNFGTLKFTGATVNGAALSAASPTAYDAANGGVIEAHTSAILGGTSFTVTWQHH